MDFNKMTAQDMRDFWHVVPESSRLMRDNISESVWLALHNTCAGASFTVPKHSQRRCARKWGQLASVLGEEGTQQLAHHYGGEVLQVPVLRAVHVVQRSRWLRRRFQELTTQQGMKPGAAVLALCIELNAAGQPMTARQIMASL